MHLTEVRPDPLPLGSAMPLGIEKRWATKDTETAAGHGGIDFFVLHGFVEAIKRRTVTPLDVYDAAAWSAITPLSERSIELGNQTVDFPDFTNGQWMYRKSKFVLTDDY